MVFLGYETIPQGERALIRDCCGGATVFDGPQRILLYRSTVEYLTRYFAPEGSYLLVDQISGPKITVPGPASMFFNPTEHISIEVKAATFVIANQALVVYCETHEEDELGNINNDDAVKRQKGDDGGSQLSRPGKGGLKSSFRRKIIYGPTKYIPSAGEWLHEFSWHGSATRGGTDKVANALRFTLLRVIPDQFYYDVHDVRTRDDTLLTCKLMVFYELVNVEKMLDTTVDPIADFINATCSDVVSFVSQMSYEEFVNRTGELNELEKYKTLTTRSERIGYTVNKVVFRGFNSSSALQNMHDKAIQERTALRLNADTESQKQHNLDMVLAKEAERAQLQRKLQRDTEDHKMQIEMAKQEHDVRMERAKQDSNLAMEQMNHEHSLRMGMSQHEQTMALQTNEHDQTIVQARQKDELEVEKLEKLKKMGVDLTQVLVARSKEFDKWIKFQ